MEDSINICEKCVEKENEIRRMLIALEAMKRIAEDMLDPVRRAGPTYPK